MQSLEGALAEMFRDPAKQLAQIVSIVHITASTTCVGRAAALSLGE
jgi:hypothetical protein